MNRNQSGFTLVEIILAVTVLAILVGFILGALNPNKQLGKARNIERKSDINVIYEAIYQYWLDHGDFPDTITTTPTQICRITAEDCTGYIDLSVLSTESPYISILPTDPTCSDENTTGYTVHRSSMTGGYVIVQATCAEDGAAVYRPTEWTGSVGGGGGGDACESGCSVTISFDDNAWCLEFEDDGGTPLAAIGNMSCGYTFASGDTEWAWSSGTPQGQDMQPGITLTAPAQAAIEGAIEGFFTGSTIAFDFSGWVSSSQLQFTVTGPGTLAGQGGSGTWGFVTRKYLSEQTFSVTAGGGGGSDIAECEGAADCNACVNSGGYWNSSNSPGCFCENTEFLDMSQQYGSYSCVATCNESYSIDQDCYDFSDWPGYDKVTYGAGCVDGGGTLVNSVCIF